ncbi:DUF456 domain-containing protein [Halanaeroarchaeum sulfurireducens]|nr:DUF456 domain-containing protein [Halanaeroarchaeum sulfurireducens]
MPRATSSTSATDTDPNAPNETAISLETLNTVMDPLVAVAFVLLGFGVVASVVPILPAGAVSMAGVLLYWWVTGRPGPIAVAILLMTGIVALAVDWVAGLVGANVGGASLRTGIVATAVGLLLFVLTGPVGLVAGIGGTVFAIELSRGASREASLRAAGFAVIGVLGSALMQAVLTGAILVSMALIYL